MALDWGEKEKDMACPNCRVNISMCPFSCTLLATYGAWALTTAIIKVEIKVATPTQPYSHTASQAIRYLRYLKR